jgi:hypothetical protein
VEKRLKSRTGVSITMPIHLVDSRDGNMISCRLFDVSATGIGIIMKKGLAVGQIVSFQTLGKTYELEVTWSEANGVNCRCGLGLVDKSQNLSILFSSFDTYRRAV